MQQIAGSDVTTTSLKGSAYPSVTVVMPIRNEGAYIERSLDAVLSQDYPVDRLAVLIVDGMSSDRTRAIIHETLNQHLRNGRDPSCGMSDRRPSIACRLLDNPAHIVSTALNIGLRHAQGDIIIRVDGHCEIASDYVQQCVSYLEETGAACVGGPIETIGETLVARSIATAMSSPFGVGNSAFRTVTDDARYVDTVAFGAYRREVFEHIGYFDEELVRNQDDEFNFRLTQAGGRIFMTPDVRSVYYSRANLKSLWRQYFEYGLYKIRVIQKRGAVPSWRHLVPVSFVLGLLGSLLMALLTRQPLWALVVAGPYAVANLGASIHAARHNSKLLPILPLAFLAIHVAYGLGFLSGLWHWRDHWLSTFQQTEVQTPGQT